jgi:hypothetical protein
MNWWMMARGIARVEKHFWSSLPQTAQKLAETVKA